jgi:hypothetical protein
MQADGARLPSIRTVSSWTIRVQTRHDREDHMPDIDSPDEKQQEQLVLKQGDAYRASYNMLMAEDPHTEAAVADYRVTASFEPAEGMYEPDVDGGLAWTTPKDGANQHLEVIVRDRRDGRFIPYLDVHLRLLDQEGTVVLDTAVPFIWHPFVLHYGVDGTIPGEGDYMPEVTIPAPRFPRHDEVRGKRYEQDVTIRLAPVHLEPGVKPRGPE